jgi:ATP-dependent DNA helicase DinG
VAARIDYCREQGANPFMDYQVPQAALTLKQGFGRLIRTRMDRGVVAILDSRLAKMRYRRAFLDSLPPCPRTSDFEEIRQWWRSTRPPPESV